MARPNSISEQAFSKLINYIKSCRIQGKYTLPSEVEMCKMFQISRMTVRKILTRAKAHALLQKGPHGYAITARHIPAVQKSLVFISYGKDIFYNAVWQRSWNVLAEECRNSRIQAIPFYINNVFINNAYLELNNHAELKKQLSVYDAFVITHRVFRPLLPPGKPVFAIDENIGCDGVRLVCLDNYRAGRCAAEFLLKKGCRNIAYFGVQALEPYIPFIRRRQGFDDAMQSADTPVRVYSYWYNSKDISAFLTELQKIFSEHAEMWDGIFLHSDEKLEIIYQKITDRGLTPQIIVLFGNGDLNRRYYPLNYIDHGEKALARYIIKELETGGKTDNSPVYLPPEIKNNSLNSAEFIKP
ncbi:MAG: hypothetical protein A2096_00005 [Spirochaetes bacterium GWF1_41_5]|nr:MAG: hypothetical protein A2096_00005 [Spirochaetes bacterium GWF1_41_5]